VFIDCRIIEGKINHGEYDRRGEDVDVQRKLETSRFVNDKAMDYWKVREEKWDRKISACCRDR
jgi:hypothetical protein